jgi:hypothetical protein
MQYVVEKHVDYDQWKEFGTYDYYSLAKEYGLYCQKIHGGLFRIREILSDYDKNPVHATEPQKKYAVEELIPANEIRREKEYWTTRCVCSEKGSAEQYLNWYVNWYESNHEGTFRIREFVPELHILQEL